MDKMIFEPHAMHGETVDGEGFPLGYISIAGPIPTPVFALEPVGLVLPGVDMGRLARIMAEAPAMVEALRDFAHGAFATSYDLDDPAQVLAIQNARAILSRIDGAGDTLPDAPVPHDLEPAQNGPDGHCLHCGRDNTGHEGEPCADDCPQYCEAKGLAAPTDEPATPTGEGRGDLPAMVDDVEQAGALVRDALELLDAVAFVDDHALADGVLGVLPHEGKPFNISLRIREI